MNLKRHPVLCACASALLSACAADPGLPEPAADNAPVARSLTDALLPPVQVQLPPADTRGEARRFDVNVRGAELRPFLQSLVQDTPYSVVVHPRAEGKVTLSLRNKTVPEVVEELVQAYGYDLKRNGNSFSVLPAEVQSRTFQINYLNLKRSGQSRTRVASGQITESGAGGGQGGGQAQAGGDAQNRTSTVAGSGIETGSESDFWKELEKSLKAMVRESEGRSVVASPEAGLVVVRATPAELNAVGDYVNSLHANLHRQVMLEAKIIEVTLNDRFQAGINWGAVRQNASDSYFAGVAGAQDVFGTGVSSLSGGLLTVAPGNPISGFTSALSGGAFVLAGDFPNFNVVIELLKSQGDVRVLSSPQISTVNNQKAIIKVGTDEFFVTGVTNNSQNNASGVGNNRSQIELTPFFSGIALDVTPRIFSGEELILHVHPSVSQVSERAKLLIVDGQQQQLPLAVSNLRESDSIVRAKGGQIVVIGGLMQETSRDEQFATPLLGQIPLLGNLFKQTRKVSTKSELVILLKPTILGLDGWDGALQESRERIGEMVPGAVRVW